MTSILLLLATPVARAETATTTVDITDIATWVVLVGMAVVGVVAWGHLWRWIDARVTPALDRIDAVIEGPGLVAWSPRSHHDLALLGARWLRPGCLHVVVGPVAATLGRVGSELVTSGASVGLHNSTGTRLDLALELAQVTPPRLWELTRKPDGSLVADLASRGRPAVLVTDLLPDRGTLEVAARAAVAVVLVAAEDPQLAAAVETRGLP